MAAKIIKRHLISTTHTAEGYIYAPDHFRERFLREAAICVDDVLTDFAALNGRAALASGFAKASREAEAALDAEQHASA